MTIEDGQRFRIRFWTRVPNNYPSIETGRDQRIAIWAEADPTDPSQVTGICFGLFILQPS